MSTSRFIQFVLVGLILAVSSDANNPKNCNAEMDKMCGLMQKDIATNSPYNKKDTDSCTLLMVYNSESICRAGDVYTIKAEDEKGCTTTHIDLAFIDLKFTCKISPEKLQQIMDKYASKAGGRRRRGFFDKVPSADAEIIGLYANIRLSGQLVICKDGTCDASGLKMKELDINALNVTCKGNPLLDTMCAKSENMKEIKMGITATIQIFASSLVAKAICTGPSKIATKFKCAN